MASTTTELPESADVTVAHITPTLHGEDPEDIFTLGGVRVLGENAESIALHNPSGLAYDTSGNLYYGSMQSEPLRVDLIRRDPNGDETNLGEIINTSDGYVGYGGVTLATGPGGLVAFNAPQIMGIDGTIVHEAGIVVLDTAKGETTTLDEPKVESMGLAYDTNGRLYYGDVRYEPLKVNLIRLDPDGTRTDLGNVLDTTDGWVEGTVNLAISRDNVLAIGTPRVWDNDGNTIRDAEITLVDLATEASSVVAETETDHGFTGLAFDASGTLYFGDLTCEPFRVELFELVPGQAKVSRGTIIDTVGGWISSGHKIDIATFD